MTQRNLESLSSHTAANGKESLDLVYNSSDICKLHKISKAYTHVGMELCLGGKFRNTIQSSPCCHVPVRLGRSPHLKAVVLVIDP
jgi:hypothetical protein